MNRKQYIILVAVVIASGFIGGAFSSRFFRAQPAKAADNGVISARMFDINDGKKSRITLTTGGKSDLPAILFTDRDGETNRAIYFLGEEGTPRMAMSDENGALRVVVSQLDTGDAWIGFFDENKEKLWGAP